VAGERIDGQLPAGREDAKRNGQVKPARILRQFRRR
jgi:hypothetical protein